MSENLNLSVQKINTSNPKPGDVCKECNGSGYGEPVYTSYGPDFLDCSNCMGTGEEVDWVAHWDRIDRVCGI